MENQSLSQVTKKLVENVGLVSEISSNINELNRTLNVLCDTLIDTIEETKLNQISNLAEGLKENLGNIGKSYVNFNNEYDKLVALNEAQNESIGNRDFVIGKLEKDMALLLAKNDEMAKNFQDKLESEMQIIKKLLLCQESSKEAIVANTYGEFIAKIRETLYFASPIDDGALYMMSQNEVGLRKLGKKQYPISMVVHNETLYFMNTYDNSISRVKDNQVSCICERSCKCFGVHGEKLYVGSEEGLYCVVLETGQEISLYRGSIDKMDIIEERLYFTSEELLYAVDLKNDEIRQLV